MLAHNLPKYRAVAQRPSDSVDLLSLRQANAGRGSWNSHTECCHHNYYRIRGARKTLANTPSLTFHTDLGMSPSAAAAAAPSANYALTKKAALDYCSTKSQRATKQPSCTKASVVLHAQRRSRSAY
eukprot:TRINITY_DN867_c4_g1_i5.p2 TRINITY_DN867_c4_g1~~TRINITY_DN867_c4_g1_i5.p2  ORF type:complete len:126 (-),score=12.35 TRINITY_DN867_c4_g1_i5:66-443(-)